MLLFLQTKDVGVYCMLLVRSIKFKANPFVETGRVSRESSSSRGYSSLITSPMGPDFFHLSTLITFQDQTGLPWLRVLPCIGGEKGVCQSLAHLYDQEHGVDRRWDTLNNSGCRAGTELTGLE
jgi:hypothetical protein